MRRLTVLMALAVLIALPACGGGSDDPTSTITAGPTFYAIPFLPTASQEILALGFKNLLPTAAPVTVTAYTPGGAPYAPGPIALLIPASGEIRSSLSVFTGAGVSLGGWLHVETRNLAVLDPVTGEPTLFPTSGYVTPYVKRVMSGAEVDATPGAAFRASGARVSLTEDSFAYQVVNNSVLPMAGGSVSVAADWTITSYDAFGTALSTTSMLIPANGSMVFLTALITGRIHVDPTPPPGQTAPAGTVFRGLVTAFEEDPQVQIEAQVLEVTESGLGQRDIGFDLSFGMDAAGNFHDFAVVATNTLTTDATVTIRAINQSTGTQILTAPRFVQLDANTTKYEATTTADSRGLDTGEVSVFADLFGDVTLSSGLQALTIWVQAPMGVDVSARDYDSAFKSYYRIVPGRQGTNDMAAIGVDYEPTTLVGTRNYISLMNPLGASTEVFIVAHTPGGTEYNLGSVIVNPFGRLDWSPDGMIFREVPTDDTAPPVPYMCFRFTSVSGMFFGGRKERRDVTGVIVSMTPQVLRNLRFE